MSNIIEFWKKRDFIDSVTSEELAKRAASPLKGYIGFDPTAESLHVGNLIGIIALRWLQHFGHTPIVILGGATARIGDPSGKSVERPLLKEEEIDANVQKIRTLFEKYLDFSDPKTKPIILNNDEWLGKYPFVEFLRDVGKHFRVGPMLAKDSVRSRFESEEGISFTEFAYQVLQGYDFYYLDQNYDVCLQMGGSDQWGNIVAGIDLTRKLARKSVFGLTFPLLVRSDGKKFGKSEEGAIWLDPKLTSPYKFYQYFIRVTDEDVSKMMRLLTFIDTEEIIAIEQAMKGSQYVPNTAQKRFAEELTKFVHGKEGLETALKVTKAAAPGTSDATLDPAVLQEIIHDMPSVSLAKEEVLSKKFVDVAVASKFLSSKSEATRLIKNGGAYLNNQKIEDPALAITEKHIVAEKYCLLGAGKKRKLLIILS